MLQLEETIDLVLGNLEELPVRLQEGHPLVDTVFFLLLVVNVFFFRGDVMRSRGRFS